MTASVLSRARQIVLLGLTAAPLMSAVAPAQDAPRIPLREGLYIVTALNDPRKGDYESIKVITQVTDKNVRLTYSAETREEDAADMPLAGLFGDLGDTRTHANATGTQRKTQHIAVTRTVAVEDLQTAHEYRLRFDNGAPESYPHSTAIGVSASVLTELKTTGQTRLSVPAGGIVGMPGDAFRALLGDSRGAESAGLWAGTVKRVEAGVVPFKVLVNDQPAQLPVLHARGHLGDEDAEFWILDDADNPLVLKWTLGDSSLQVIRLSFSPLDSRATTRSAERIERALVSDGRAVVYGIYFDFASDRIKEESEPVLKEIAEVMVKNSSWTLSIEGHTDGIGGAAPNLDLSRRRAASVTQFLTTRYHIAAARLASTGFGASRPKDTNETLEGRARNRRVELVKR